VIEDPVLIVQTQEQPHTDGLQPEDHEEEPDRRQQQLTHHPDTGVTTNIRDKSRERPTITNKL